ncbi:MAG: SH3 domain-containing protein [Pseudolabrys sp.]|nr:SH3 domain-containing protein [Pseudolabrys sp.]
MRLKTGGLAGVLLLAGTTIVNAATVRSELNLRAGPGTGYGVVAVMPAGAEVDIRDCSGAWCRVVWGASEGYANADYLVDEPDAVDGPPAAGSAPAPFFNFGVSTWSFGSSGDHGWSNHRGWDTDRGVYSRERAW